MARRMEAEHDAHCDIERAQEAVHGCTTEGRSSLAMISRVTRIHYPKRASLTMAVKYTKIFPGSSWSSSG